MYVRPLFYILLESPEGRVAWCCIGVGIFSDCNWVACASATLDIIGEREIKIAD